ncbi:MAG: MerR family transcriptional regulator [Chloroflexi bacterium]|nr:MerR family transcriptional regulator [Chloroflexota bacterium]
MYNIKQAAARAGVTVPVLRAWERRYGIVNPGRSSGGYRQFDEESVARVRTMRTLVDEGWSPSAAAGAILDGSVPVRDDQPTSPAGAPTFALGGHAAQGTSPAEAAAMTERFLAAAKALQPDAITSVLDDLFARGSFERVATDLLFPALEALGDAWAAGQLSVAGEHLASSAVQRRLGQALEAAGSGDARGARVVVGMPPGGRHELGALAFAVTARRAGMPVTYLGADLPVEDWLAAVDGASAAVIGVVTARDRHAAIEVAHHLLAANPGLVVALGGRAAQAAPGIMRLPTELTESVAAVRTSIAA